MRRAAGVQVICRLCERKATAYSSRHLCTPCLRIARDLKLLASFPPVYKLEDVQALSPNEHAKLWREMTKRLRESRGYAWSCEMLGFAQGYPEQPTALDLARVIAVVGYVARAHARRTPENDVEITDAGASAVILSVGATSKPS